MAALLIADSEIGAGGSPFIAVRHDPPPAGAELGKKMRKFVPQCAIDLGVPVCKQLWIQ